MALIKTDADGERKAAEPNGLQIRDEQELLLLMRLVRSKSIFCSGRKKSMIPSLGIIFITSSQRCDPPVNPRIPIFGVLNEGNKSLNWSEFDKNRTEI